MLILSYIFFPLMKLNLYLYNNVLKVITENYKHEVENGIYAIFGIRIGYGEIIYFFFGGKGLAYGFEVPYMYKEFDYDGLIMDEDFELCVTEKYVDHFLFRYSTYGEHVYDDFPELLKIRRFRHSLKLEIIWAVFPTVIILLILVPSLLLLYSAEEDLDPEFTVKIVGHQ